MSTPPFNQAPGDARSMLVSEDGYKATYRAAISAVTPVAAPTDMVQLIGSATMLIRIKHIVISGIATTAGIMPFNLVRRKTAGTIGSAVVTAITPGQHDINDAAATLTIGTVGTANWTTVGTINGVLAAGRLALPLATANVFTPLVWDFCLRQDKAVILRGTSDYIYINGTGATLPAGSVFDYEIEWEEYANGTF